MKKYNVTVNGTAYEITLEAVDASDVKAAPAAAPAPSAAPSAPAAPVAAPVAGGKETVTSPVLMILEAMKMENEIISPCDGTVLSVGVTKGATVETGAVLCVIG